MNILIVEDSRNRIRKFYWLFGQYQLSVVNYAEGAIEMIKNQCYDIISLDYDLREGQTKGELFTRFWIENEDLTCYLRNQNEKPVVVIHSLNTTGANSMANHLNLIGLNAFVIEFFELMKMPLSKLGQIIGLNFS
jgi:CheY-like chemotaxis protein